MINASVIDALEQIDEHDTAKKLRDCATYVKITECPTCGAHITGANFCRQRTCMICAWRRQARFRVDMLRILDRLDKPDTAYRLITLTVRNCAYTDLGESLNDMLRGFSKLTQRAAWRKCVDGFVRGVEVTYNNEQRTWHPHIHIIALPKQYISIRKIRQLWIDIMHLDYNPQIDIRPITDKMAVAETLKYALKYNFTKDGLIDPQVLKIMMSALRNRRLISFGGIFKSVKAALKIEDIDKQDLTDSDYDNHPCKYCNSHVQDAIYQFDVSGGIYRLYNPYDFM